MYRLIGANQIEIISERAGSHKIIFDSYYPFRDTALFTGRLLNAFLSEEEKQNIASNNIKNVVNPYGLVAKLLMILYNDS